MHTSCCKEFYANLAVFIYKKKEIAKSRVKGVEIEFDSMKRPRLLDVPGHTGISEYIKEVWGESKYIKPLEITRKFANNISINVARRVQSTEMKTFQRFVHFVVMKNMVPRFGKRDTTSFMDLTYMDHLVSGRKINLPRVMMRHMAYVISVKDHELSYGDWVSMIFDAFRVPLVDKKGEEPKRYDYFEETFLTMCKLKREDGIWWIGTGENRRRDDDDEAPEEEVEEEEKDRTDFDWEAVVDEAVIDELQLRGNPDQMSSFKMLKWMWKNRCERLQLLGSGCSKLRFDEGSNDDQESTPRVPLVEFQKQ
ncbi:hypothetical protein Dimus_004988 [Dionaea muscipula]